ncbi:MAG TPA: HAD-IC family P-type ATPase [Candidatus Lustribacter sp.]|nr:HAD-IC family P-type ATPase [Candidatus Lustribacter sp.]
MTNGGAQFGLTSAQVAERVARGEVNATVEVTSRPLGEIVKANVLTRFNAVLGTLFVLVLLTGRYGDALFGWALILNSAFGIAQEWSAKRKLDSLAVLNVPTVHVVRDGSEVEIATGAVVRDDVVALRAGDQVPADGPLLAGDNLEVDESNLTGESDAVAKHPGDRLSSGTAVVAGHGSFRAEVVGEATEANTLSAQARKFRRAYSDVQHSINVLLRYLTWAVVAAVPIVTWSQVRAVGDQGWREVVLRVAAALVGLIPEGLVLLTTLAFVVAAVRLTRRHALIQELPAVEGLARVDIICLDKTGTLTVGDIAFDRVEAVPGIGMDEARAALGAIAHVPDANATTGAIAAAVPDPGWPGDGGVPFSSARKWSAASFQGGGVWVLGAPDVILTACPDGPDRAWVQARTGELADTGDRVVLLARAPSLPVDDEPHDLAPTALVILAEQIRPDAQETLDYFASQGVGVKVISGDNPRTVSAVARKVGLDPGTPVDARSLPDDPDALAEIVEATTVFGRVSPGQKRDLVRALQARGHVVAMTGDGVNDLLALKDADIGVAMGNAAPATKAVAQLVLLDGRFAHLPSVLAEGRKVIGNVERVASLFVAKNIMSAVAILATALAGLGFPFLPRHLTLLSTLTIGIPAAVLALGPNRRRYTPGLLGRVLRLSIPAGIAAGLVSFATYWLASSVGADTETQRGTAALLALLVVSFWLLAVLARPYLLWKVALIGTMVAAALAAFLVPAGRRLFVLDVQGGTLVEALVIGGLGAVAVEVAYRASRRH